MKSQFKKYGMLSILVMMIWWLFAVPVQAQDGLPSPDYIYICVDPSARPDASDSYLISFRETDLFGLIIPENAVVTAYSSNQARLLVALYAITPDALTGGYRRGNRIATAYTPEVIPVPSGRRSCEQDPELITSDLLSTIPLPVSPDHGLIIQSNPAPNSDSVDTLPFEAAFALAFRSQEFSLNFQVVQMNNEPIELGIPAPAQLTCYILVANIEARAVEVRRRTTPDSNLIGEGELISRGELDVELSVQGQSCGSTPANVIQMMTNGDIQIFPHSGRVYIYPNGGSIELHADAISRARFSQGDTIRPIEGIERVNYYLPNNLRDAAGCLGPCTSQTARVDEVNENGLLVITFPDNETRYVILESWLVEVAD